jgi:hypothetical protein
MDAMDPSFLLLNWGNVAPQQPVNWPLPTSAQGIIIIIIIIRLI